MFKLVDNTLQCLSLKEVGINTVSMSSTLQSMCTYTLCHIQKLQSEIDLMDVKEVKAYHSPNSQMFPFHVHFKGKDSPWILSANSQVC